MSETTTTDRTGIAVGDTVIYHDEYDRPRAALVTANHGPANGRPSLNLVLVEADDTRVDPYGRQIVRETSVPHGTMQYANGRYWLLPGEPHVPTAR